MNLEIFIKFLIITSVVISIINSIVSYQVHREMNIRDTYKYKKGTFKEFKEKFEEHNWKINKSFKYSFFNRFDANFGSYLSYYIHADIIRFDNVNMVLPFIDYFKFVSWRKKEWEKYLKMEG